MRVILRENVEHLGTVGDVVKVKPGYARNFLLPRGLAMIANDKNVHALEAQQQSLAKKRERVRNEADQFATALGETHLTIARKTGKEGKLFGSVTSKDIEAELAKIEIRVSRKQIQLTEPIKQVGTHTVTVRVLGDIKAMLKVTVESDGSTPSEEERPAPVKARAPETEAAAETEGEAEAPAEAGSTDDAQPE